MTRGLHPCSGQRAAERALRMVNRGGQYVWGTGNFNAKATALSAQDVPWTMRILDDVQVWGTDCAGLICYAYELTRHRRGFNSRRGATIVDDINVDSLLEDAEPVLGRGELTERLELPELGAVIAYPTIRHPAREQPFWGHVGIVVGAFGGITIEQLADTWDPWRPDYRRLKVAHACGPNFRKPGVIVTDGQTWARHDELWGKPEHRTRLLRVRVLEERDGQV